MKIIFLFLILFSTIFSNSLDIIDSNEIKTCMNFCSRAYLSSNYCSYYYNMNLCQLQVKYNLQKCYLSCNPQ
jgi:hypothetical protein